MNIHEDAGSSYRVGNKRPPRHTQFKEGESGNPSGKKRERKPSSESLIEVLDEYLRQTVTVTVGDRPKRMTRFQALALGLIVDAQKGKAGARKQLFDLLRTGKSQGDPALIKVDAEPHKFNWTEEHSRILAKLEAAYAEIEADEAAEANQGKLPPAAPQNAQKAPALNREGAA